MQTAHYPITTDFIKLHKLCLGEYEILYQSESEGLKSNDYNRLLQFIGFVNKSQELNLVYIDSAFPQLLADVVCNAYKFHFDCLNDFLEYKFKHQNAHTEFDKQLMKRRFREFLHLLLYADISNPNVNQINFNHDKIFCSRNENGELVYYTIYELNLLQNHLVNNMKFKVKKVKQNENELVLKLKLIVDESF